MIFRAEARAWERHRRRRRIRDVGLIVIAGAIIVALLVIAFLVTPSTTSAAERHAIRRTYPRCLPITQPHPPVFGMPGGWVPDPARPHCWTWSTVTFPQG